MKKILSLAAVSAVLFFLFTHPGHIAAGCSLGLTLWYTSVLPSLLPFLILSGLLMKTGLFHRMNRIYAPVLKRIFRISDEGCYAILVGFLCGFPMGAKVVADLVREKHISVREGTYLLGFCNNVSPAFFLNYICLMKLQFPEVPLRLVLGFYMIPICYGLITRPFYHFPADHGLINQKQTPLHRMDFPMLDVCIMDGFSTITKLGGYIILFTILVQLLKLLPISPAALAILSAILEISCGADLLSSLTGLPAICRTALVCAFAAFGGLCICAQTKSVLTDTPLRVTAWLIGRIVTALLTFLLLLLPVLLPSAVQALTGCC